ncbi:hypothetical protein WME79_23270 [Sorangium sp. So ce726]|uniref:hypothetical protein n=1 Tax=Sorangium sp. So ce726 TaxID=3133319 RepID=UPI003F5F2B60
MAANFDAERFLGTWHIVATNYGFWKNRIHPTVTYSRCPGPGFCMSDRLSFEARPLFGGQYRPAVLEGIDTQDAQHAAHFVWRGAGILGLIRSPWYVVAVGEAYDWAVTYFGRSNVGTAPGVDIYSREPSLAPEKVKAILKDLRADPFMAAKSDGMFATVQPGVPPGQVAL